MRRNVSTKKLPTNSWVDYYGDGLYSKLDKGMKRIARKWNRKRINKDFLEEQGDE